MKDCAQPLQHIEHGIPPVFDERSEVLVLGTMPSPKSREVAFFYGHPQNRFWKLMARLLKEPLPVSVEEKKAMLLKHHIAIWDVVAECDIHGSSDGSIRNVIPTNLNQILREADIQTIIANGTAAYTLYHTYCEEHTGRTAVKCPSTSPANAVFTLDRLEDAWGKVFLDLYPQLDL